MHTLHACSMHTWVVLSVDARIMHNIMDICILALEYAYYLLLCIILCISILAYSSMHTSSYSAHKMHRTRVVIIFS